MPIASAWIFLNELNLEGFVFFARWSMTPPRAPDAGNLGTRQYVGFAMYRRCNHLRNLRRLQKCATVQQVRMHLGFGVNSHYIVKISYICCMCSGSLYHYWPNRFQFMLCEALFVTAMCIHPVWSSCSICNPCLACMRIISYQALFCW